MKNICILLIGIFALAACKKTSSGFNKDLDVFIKYENANGQNLLDEATPGYIKPEGLRVFLLKDGQRIEMRHPNLTYPQNFRIIDTSIGKHLQFFFEDYKKTDKIIMYMQYPDGTEDKFTGQFNVDRYPSIYITKFWVNDVLKWDLPPDRSSLANAKIIK